MVGHFGSSEFEIHSTKNSFSCCSPGQLIFGLDMILMIKHTVDWELIHQQKKAQINKDNIRENRNRVDHDYKVVDKVVLNNNSAYKYETPFKGPFVITQCFINVTVSLQYGPIKITYNILSRYY